MQVTEVFQFLARIVVLPIIPQKNLFASPFQRSTLCCLAYYLIIFSIVQFSRCRQKIHFHVPSKLNKVRSPQKGLTLGSLFEWLRTCLLRKEVIQPLVLERLPCYDFTPIIEPTFGRALLAVRLRTSGVPDSHGVTGGVYKARERIHRGMLIRDY